MSIAISEIELEGNAFEKNAVKLMPVSFKAEDNNKYSSTAISFWKYAKNELDLQLFSEPEVLVEQRSGEWFGPMILLSSAVVSGNSELISVFCGVVSNYLTDFFKGSSESPQIKLKVLYKETKSTKTTEISYEGDINGLDKLESSILEVVKRDKS